MSEKLPLSKVVAMLATAAAEAVVKIESIDSNDINTLLKAFKQLHDCRKAIEEVSKVLYHTYETLSSETIPTAFQSINVDSVKSNGTNFILGTQFYASIPSDKSEAGHQWLRDNGYGFLVKPSVNSKSLSSVIKAYIEEKGLEPPVEVMSTHRKLAIQMRKT